MKIAQASREEVGGCKMKTTMVYCDATLADPQQVWLKYMQVTMRPKK
jgi:hypothetical protein